jgi:CBS domain-containing protein
MEDIAGLLAAYPPFDAVGADELARVAAVTETERTPGGKTIFSQGTGPVEYLRVVGTGSVEIIHDGQVLDLLGPGELFGHASMLSGLPAGFEARAAEDTLCYRIPAEVIGPLLARPDFLAFIARSMVGDRTGAVERVPPVDLVQRPVATLIRTPPAVRRDARDRDRSRPALACRGRGCQSRRAHVRHHERARLHRPRRQPWR